MPNSLKTVLLVLALMAPAAGAGAQTGLAALRGDEKSEAPARQSVVVLEKGEEAAGGLIPASWRPRSASLNWVDYGLVAAATGATVVAIHYKFRADHRADRYIQTGDPALRREVRRLDLKSGVALAAAQVGLGVFAFRLVLR